MLDKKEIDGELLRLIGTGGDCSLIAHLSSLDTGYWILDTGRKEIDGELLRLIATGYRRVGW